jgi:predicted esterase
MTSRNRDRRITENVQYVDSVIRQVMKSCSVNDRLCFHGFSQGCGMACRALLLGSYGADGLMLLGGDIPPELSVKSCISQMHLARGNRDRLYTQEQYEHDYARIRESGVSFTGILFSGGHGANAEYFHAAAVFLAQL